MTKPDQLVDAGGASMATAGVGESAHTSSATRRNSRLRLPRPLTTVALIAAVLFTIAGIGSPLLGLSVFAATDELSTNSPYFDTGGADTVVQNTYMDDTYNAEMPAVLLYVQSVRNGEPAAWNPYIAAGTPLGATPTYALFSPLSLPYYVLPGWFAPAYAKLLEIGVTLLGCYLFLRRLRLRPPAALLGGTVFASSAFMTMWTNWPQTRVAALIPWVFWAAERLVQRRRVTDGVLLAVSVAFMLLGGFPAVTAFTLMTVGPYFLVRVVAEYASLRRRVAGLVLGAGAAVIGGVALAAIQLLPFAYFYSTWLIEGRSQGPSDHLNLTELATIFAPWAFGGVSHRAGEPYWYIGHNMVEASSYLGAAALVLVVVTVAWARAGRSLLPRGAWAFFVAAGGIWLVLIYLGGPLRFLQEMPVFATNFVGRARSILGFVLAVLSAVGLQLLLSRRAAAPAGSADIATAIPNRRPWRPGWGVAVWLGACGTVAVLVWNASRAARAADRRLGVTTVDRSDYATRQLLIGLGLLALAVLAVAALWWGAGRATTRSRVVRFGAASMLILLVAGQALTYVEPYWPRVPRETFYPVTDTHAFLAANLGHERYVGTTTAMYMGLDSPKRLRALTGHTFVNAELAQMIGAIPGNASRWPTHVLMRAQLAQATNPILDRLGGRYIVTAPRDQVFGVAHVARGDGSTVRLASGETLTAPIQIGGPMRAVGVTPASEGLPDVADDSWVEVNVRDGAGRTVATGRRLTAGMTTGEPFLVPVAGEEVAAGTALTVAVTLHAAGTILVSATQGRPAISSVAPHDDGLKLVYAGSSVIYQRLTALPRIRWASSSVVEPDEDRRVALLAAGSLPADRVVLNEPGAPADGLPAVVRVDDDATDVISVSVDADGAGYLVIADAIQAGWTATVDGRPARLLPADQGVVAVAVDAGRHTVELRYASPYLGAGGWISLATLLAVIGLVAVDRRRAISGTPIAADNGGAPRR